MNFFLNDTIVAISSGLINQPIGIIRISGPDTFKIINKIFAPKIKNINRTISHGFIYKKNIKIDEVLIMSFKAPKSFTGQNMVEINSHGGIIVTQEILKLLVLNGARLAEKGEFTQRAFLNGKINLIKAEAIHDLIFAKTTNQSQMAINKFDGYTSKLIQKLQKQILTIIAICETNIDYPEYDDVEKLTDNKLLPELIKIKKQFQKILEISNLAKPFYNGIKVSIVGKPNVGKSSLFNLLINENKAIVSNLPGTTRDIVEGQIQIDNLFLFFCDTAGIHKTNNKIEKMGIQKTQYNMKNADLIIHILDAKKSKLSKIDQEIKNNSKNKKYIQVFNKIDLIAPKIIKNGISVKNKKIDNLIEQIKNMYQKINLNDEKIIYNTRQLISIEKSYKTLENAIKSLKQKIFIDIVLIDIKKTWEHLGNILGNNNDNDKLLDQIFSQFCLGK